MNNLWMIHEITQQDVGIISEFLNPRMDILFFDDAVMSQMKISDIMMRKKFKCILGVSVDIADKAPLHQTDTFAYKTSILHQRWHEYGDASGFMSWDDIISLYMNYDVEIAYHGTSHNRLFTDIKKYYYDIERGYNIFIERTGIRPIHYVYPYNESNDLTDSVIKKFNMVPVGRGRKDFAKFRISL